MSSIKTDKEIRKILDLKNPMDYKGKRQREACRLLNKQFIKVFNVGYKYGVKDAGENAIKQCLDF